MRFKHFVKPLSGLFRPEASHAPTLDTQVAALESASPEALVAATLGDGADAVRAAAVRRLPDGEPLRKLAGLSEDASTHVPSNLERIAQERVAELIDAGAVDFAALRASSKNIDTVLSVAAACANPDCLPEVLASIQDPQQVSSLVV